MGMTLAEALASPQMQTALQEAAKDAVAEMVTSDDFKSAIQTSVTSAVTEVQESLATTTPKALAEKAKELIEASKLPEGKARDALIEDYSEGGRALAAIKPAKDATTGAIVKTAPDVLAESLDADLKRQTEILAEAKPTTPFSLGGAGGSGGSKPATPPKRAFLGNGSQAGAKMAELGLDVGQFGAVTKTPEAATA